jgi:molybdenum cofactor synthesis domain-containing protein
LARLKGFQKLTSIDQALKKLLDAVRIGKLKTTTVDLPLALNRILAENIIAEEGLPGFDRSAVDGYAVKAEDTVRASQFNPKILKIVEKNEISTGQVRQTWTGKPIPKGANAVVMLENTKQTDGEVEVWTSLTPWENVSRKGEDVQKGEMALEAGIRLKPQHLGMIAAFGKAEVKVFAKPKVAVLTTGNELIEIGGKLERSQIFDSNRLIISSMCRELGAEPVDLGIARDEINEVVKKLRTGMEKADLIITTGGTSVGAADFVPEALNKIGEPGVIVHGVAMRPGMPTALAVVEGKPIIALSGNPVAAMIGFDIFGRPLIRRMLGLKQAEPRPTVSAKITRRVNAALGRRTFVRVRVSRSRGEFLAEPVSAKGSGLISTITKSNGYVMVPENREGLEEGEIVSVHLFDNLEGVDGDV